MRAGGELLDARPGRAQPVPDPAERARRTRGAGSRSPASAANAKRVAAREPEVERVGGEDERRDAEAARAHAAGPAAARPSPRAPGSSATPAIRVSIASPVTSAGAEPAAALGEQERADREREEERLAVDGAEEQRHREDGEVEHRAARAVGAEARLGEPVEEDERGERAASETTIPASDVVAAEGAADARRA